MNVFAYTAEQHDGRPVRGIIEADDLATAESQLLAMGLRILELAPTATPVQPVRLGTADLQTFNEHLLQISLAGLPVEGGLAALSRELRSGNLKQAIDGLTAELQAGVPLEKAVAGRRGSFPPLYGHLIDAGVQSGDLPGVLGRFGQHAQTVADLRASLWRAASYPAVVLIALLVLLTFLGYGVFPKYFSLLESMTFRTISPGGRSFSGTSVQTIHLPAMAWVMMYLGQAAPFLLAFAAIALLVGTVTYAAMRGRGQERGWVDAATRLPIIGMALRDSYVASWLDVASIGVGAGLDLPRALRLAGDAVSLPSISRDTDAIVERLEHGARAGDAGIACLPATVPMAIDLANGPGQLPHALRALATQFEQQARRQIALVPGRVMPALLIFTGLLAGGILYSLWIPLAQVFTAFS